MIAFDHPAWVCDHGGRYTQMEAAGIVITYHRAWARASPSYGHHRTAFRLVWDESRRMAWPFWLEVEVAV
jgi:hypothetical protein